MEKSYTHNEIEKKWYNFWEKNSFFHADEKSSKKPYCIVMPPPNVTGSLHMGHALVNTLQDILIRYRRMQNFETLWIPGTDHAGISTQTIVEKNLIKKLGKRRKDFSKEEFLSYIWNWKEEKEEIILSQLRKLGCSCDWSRLRFTMDESSSYAIKVLFKKMFDDKLIYRDDYLINWDPSTQTALADDEVDYEERDSFLYYFKYFLKNSDEYIVIATTRPETMLGDTAIAFAPNDPRFVSLKGKKAILPIIKRELPIIEDHLIDPNFGSGLVKITPAHDHTDYEIAQRHNLEIINIMNPDGSINENGKEFQGLKMLEAREEIIKKMKKLNLFAKQEPHKIKIGLSYRSKAIIEPFISKQWFVKMEPFKKKLTDLIKEKKIEIIPQFWEENYFYWINNIKDWCISRQLWWGHQIPVWYNKKDPSKMICHIEEKLPDEISQNISDWYQDEDVLDTWFSSALWPFSTLGWPNKTKELEKFYPNSVLITGHDIIFFWVARMILMGEYATGKIPFQKTFLHGLIYSKSYWKKEKDGSISYLPYTEKIKYEMKKKLPKEIFSKWEKMSKTKGNVIDPLDIIDQYGTDAMRIALASSVTYARQIDLDTRRFYEFKNFINKIWNAFRFLFQNVIKNQNPLTSESFLKGLDKKLFTIEDRWILSLLNRLIDQEKKYLEEFHFDKASTILYEFFWNEFCAYYLEIIKPYLFEKENKKIQKNKQKLLTIIFLILIRLLHPFLPFITEEFFSLLKSHFKDFKIKNNIDIYTKDALEALNKQACIVSNYPSILDEKDIDEELEKRFEKIKKIVSSIRNIKSEINIPLSQRIDLYLFSSTLDKKFIDELTPIILTLNNIENLHITDNKKDLPKIFSSKTIDDIKVIITLSSDLIKKEKIRLNKEKEKLLKKQDLLQKKMEDQNFLKNAPKNIIEKIQKECKNIKNNLDEIKNKMLNL
ncbi:MAG: valine--tRNA ligase [Chlamydiae bacterium SM23_39]|nr:MAG: valine--tRNA ligase [Chlamydiae bacterium SM23_39]